MFDLKFNRFMTTSLVRLVYVCGLVFALIGLVTTEIAAMMRMAHAQMDAAAPAGGGYSSPPSAAALLPAAASGMFHPVVMMLLGLVGWALFVLVLRVACEGVIVLFSLADNTRRLVEIEEQRDSGQRA